MRFIVFIPFLLCLLLSFSAYAFRVSPMVYDLAASGAGATKTIRVDNGNSELLPVEVFAQKRIIHEDGTESREPAEDDFLIFPPQFSVEPGQSQAIRIQYIGPQDIEKSQGYVITVAQLPVNFEAEEQAGVKFAFEFGTSVNVIPEGARPDVKVTDVHPVSDQIIEVMAENTGDAYTRMIYGRWLFKNEAGAEFILEGDALREAVEQPLIQPGTKRRLRFALPDGFALAGLRVRYEE